MAETQPPAAGQGLPWPDRYADLQADIGKRWGVEGAIYLVRKLSGGKSGALVYAADLDSRDFAGQAILKLDNYPDAESQQANEAERHRDALKRAPGFATAHLPQIVNTYFRDQRLAILSTIAGRGLEYAEPWANCPYDVQLAIASRLSREILEDWNRDYSLTDGLRTPRELLRGWLAYRIDSSTGRIHEFVRRRHGVLPEQPTFSFDGDWFPNPLAIADGQAPLPDHLRLRAVIGNAHEDLHGYNVLVARRPEHEASYYLIDLALFEADQYLFYDHAYFELTHLLRSRNTAKPESWLSILDSAGRVGQGGTVKQGDDLGLVQLIAAVRRELFDWVDRHQGNRLSHMESQALLARVAAGLCFTHREISSESRSIAFLYAAQNLKELLRHNGVDWPKDGPPITIAADVGRADSARPTTVAQSDENSRSAEAGEPALLTKQAIAVLKFENIGGDPEQDYFAEGFAEDLVTELARIDWLNVISHESAHAYKAAAADTRQVGKELGVRYVVTGSVRRIADTVRITAHLVDADNRGEIWSERYDRKVTDLFSVQDDIAAAIVANIDSEVKTTERDQAARKRGPLSVWEMYQKAMWHFFKVTPEDDKQASAEAHRAIRAAPEFAGARAVLAMLETRRVLMGLSTDPAKSLEHAADNARRAVVLDRNSAVAHMANASILLVQGNRQAAIAEAELATQLNPSSANAHIILGATLYWSGRSSEALAILERAIRFNPRDRALFALKCLQALCNAEIGNLPAAEDFARQAEAAEPRAAWAQLALAVIFVRGDRLEEAHAAVAALCRLRPGYRSADIATIVQGMVADQRDRFLGDLRKAGLTD